MLRVQSLRQIVSSLPIAVVVLTLGCSEGGVSPSNSSSVHGAPSGGVGGVAANIQISPSSTSLEEGSGARLTCSAFDSREVAVASSRSWTISDPTVATVAQDGTVSALRAGTAVASCTVDGKTAMAAVSVSASPVAFVEVTPGAGILGVGGSMQLVGTPRDSTGAVVPGRTVAWTTADSNIVGVSSTGSIVGRVEGSATIVAMVGGKASLAKVAVAKGKQAPVASVSISIGSTALNVGQSVSATASTYDDTGKPLNNRSITWSVSNTSVLSVVSTSGNGAKVTARQIGSATVTATSEGQSFSVPVTVSLAPVQKVVVGLSSTSILKGQTAQASATLTDASGNVLTGRTVTWSSLDQSIATVSSVGVVTAVSTGAVIIRATSEGVAGDGTETVGVTPVASVTTGLSSTSLAPGQTAQATAVARDASGNILTGRFVSWSSLNTAVATVSTAGVVTAVTGGSASIRATIETQTGDAALTVNAPTAPAPTVANVNVQFGSQNVTAGGTTQAVAVATDASGATITGRTVTWSSMTPSIASVSASGLVTTIAAGTATIRATVDTKTGDGNVTVAAAAAPTQPTNPGIAAVEPTAPALLTTSVASTPSNGRTLRVAAGGNLQAAIDSAVPGDRILVAAGATFTGNFHLPPKSASSSWITIQSDGSLPTEGARMTPSVATTVRPPKLVSPNVLAVVSADPFSNRWRLVGLELTNDATLTTSNNIVELGGSTVSTLASIPKNIIFDRNYIHSWPAQWIHRCVTLNSDSTAIVDSYISECHADVDAQAVWGWNGNGPYKIVNNYLEASTEVLGFGGADPSFPNLVPSDIEIRGNHITRPMSWKGSQWLEKNLVEFKTGHRVLIQGNVLENSWVQAQLGWAFVMWSVNQNGGCTWCGTQDVVIQDNLIRNVSAGFQLDDKYSTPSVPMNRVAVRNNVLIGVDNPNIVGGGYGFLIQGNISALSVEHNTVFVPTTSSLQWLTNGLNANHIVRNNLVGGGNYPLYASPSNTWTSFAGTGSDFSGNVVALGAYFGTAYPSSNYYPATLDAVGLAGGATAAYSVSSTPASLALAPSSQYKGKATDGTDPGANMDRIIAAVANVIVP